MEARPSHKRSKSAKVLNLLRTTGQNTPKDSGSDVDSPITRTSTDGPPMNTSSTHLSPLTATTTKTSQYSMDSSSPTTLNEGDTMPTSAPSGLSTTTTNTPSIDDSVRTFRVFEVLRSKDTAAISKAIAENQPSNAIPGTTILHLAVQCAEPAVVDQVLQESKSLDINAQDREGNTALHLAAQLGRSPVVKTILEHEDVNDAIVNRHGKMAIDLARTPEIFGQLQLARSLFLDHTVKRVQHLVASSDYKKIDDLLSDPRVEGTLDVNALELPTEQTTVQHGGTLLHEAARKKDLQLAQLLLLRGADPFRRDRKGKLPQDVTKDDRTRAILKKSPAAAAAQRGIQEKAILGSRTGDRRSSIGERVDTSKDAREMKGYLKKWTNYTSGYKLRWFVLEDGVLSYYKHQDDAGSACRGAINMRIGRLHMDASDKTRFEIHGKSSVKYHLKANHVVEAKRWFWSLNNAIQYAKDEAKEEQRSKLGPQISHDDPSRNGSDGDSRMKNWSGHLSAAPSTSKVSFRSDVDATSQYEPSLVGEDLHQFPTHPATATMDGEEDMDGDDASSHEVHHPGSKDAFNITAQSAKLQLDLLGRVSGALNSRQNTHPNTSINDPEVSSALMAYDTAASNLSTLIADLLRISKDRDAYWQYRLDRDADARRMWEESMAQIAQEHEDLQKSMEESEDKRKRTKKALKEALEGQGSRPQSRMGADTLRSSQQITFKETVLDEKVRPEAVMSARQQRRTSMSVRQGNRRKSVIAQYTNLSDSESGDDEEFFDAIDAGEVEVIENPLLSPPPVSMSKAEEAKQEPFPTQSDEHDPRTKKALEIKPSYAGYEGGVRKKMKLDADNRPKISLWGILKSMIGKDMTKMTLPVSFNEPTSLLQRVAEDMEYADLLDIAADRPDATERMVYVAAFAASEYASTTGRVAKPFNPLLGETYEYVRPDKGYRFVIEQVSHHPPVGAAHAEAERWDYWGESAVKSKFYGKSFEINPLGTWFLRLRVPNKAAGGSGSAGYTEELYTWKKVTSSVVGIITGNPVVDNYGPMEIKNWTTGETAVLDFKQRGWKASSAFHVQGKVMDKEGVTRWSIGGKWNDKIYARQTEGFEDQSIGEGKHSAILVWEVHNRPTGVPFNLTPFVVTLNAVDDHLRKTLPPTDTRLRPDQRAMEDGEYDLAAEEKNRVEEKQRAARRKREAEGAEWEPKWFVKRKDEVTGEGYWHATGAYWQQRKELDWKKCDDIF